MSSGKIERILKTARVVAVVGLSRNPAKDSHGVAFYLKTHGYRIVPVNPFADKILGEKSYPSLQQIPLELQRTIDLVDIFRPSGDVPSIVEEAIRMRKKNGKPDVIWMQLGIIHEDAARKAKATGLQVVTDRCTRTEHRILLGDL